MGDAKAFNIKTLAGEITILDNHEPIISMFDKGAVSIIDRRDERKYMEINAGFLEMTPENELNVLTE
jgi:F0F1-type ATP synthase epsilon subunit